MFISVFTDKNNIETMGKAGMKNYLYGIAVFALLFLYGCDSQTTQEPAELSPTELSSEPNAEANAPDTVFVNGKILTVDESFSVVDALAVDGDRIVALGDSATIGALAGDDTNVIDLGGKTVIPGLIVTICTLFAPGRSGICKRVLTV